MKAKAKKILRGTILVLLFLASLFWISSLYSYLTLPNLSKLKDENPTTTAFMERYREEKPLSFYWVSYTKISPYLKGAVVIAEDSNFFSHNGVDWGAVWHAFKSNWKEKEFKRGGSTITQQLAKNLYLSPSKNPFRKLKEILIAYALEKELSKQRILELYLNVVEWGKGIYGAEAAARHYFNTSASSLSPYQAAMLAAMLPSPRSFQKRFHSRYLEDRAIKILTRLNL